MPQLSGKQLRNRTVLPTKFKEMPWKESVRATSTGNLNLAVMPANVDGVALNQDDRFLAKDQTALAENGIYVFNGAGAVATRSTDANTTAELNAAMVNTVEGTINANAAYQQHTANPTVDVSAIVWDPIGTDLEAGEGITLIGKEITVVAGDTSIEVDGDGVKAAVPYQGDKAMAPLATAADTNYEDSGLIMDRTPAGDGYVGVGVNGQDMDVADGDRDAGDCYFSDDAGATAKAMSDIVEEDGMFWNGGADKAGFKLDIDDSISFFYSVVQAANSSSSSA